MSAHILIIGTGVAGLSSALSAAHAGADVTLVAEGRDLTERGGNTQLAQGGIAAAIGAHDQPSRHASDTVAAGAGLVDLRAATLLTTHGARAMLDIIGDGFAIDRDAAGDPVMGLEGAHGEHRIVHAGEDRTGATLHSFLRGRVLREVRLGRVLVLPEHTAVSLIVTDGKAQGARLQNASGAIVTHSADAVILATGGYAGLYPRSTNAVGMHGSGILLGARVGATLTDLEFVQFHPTVLHGTGALISEAVRGAGAVLRDSAGRPFMRDAHPLGDLAPRDVVSREIHRVLREHGGSSVWLDATALDVPARGSSFARGALAKRFPAITAAISAAGHDWAREPVPVSPAAHYCMGGIATDLDARTSVPGLFAAGEVAATGVHGANRLASNSLLEGLVFGSRAGRAAAAIGIAGARESTLDWSYSGDEMRNLETEQLVVTVAGGRSPLDQTASPDAAAVAAAVARGLGIVRSEEDFRAASHVFAAASGQTAQLASLVLAAAETRTESRGTHQRSDYPSTDPDQALRRSMRVAFAASATPLTTTPIWANAAKEPHPC